MSVQLKIVASVALAVCGVTLAGCQKADTKPQADPYSSDGVVRKIVEQGVLLSDAVKAKDFPSIDTQAYYLQGMVKALQSKLDAGQNNAWQDFSTKSSRWLRSWIMRPVGDMKRPRSPAWTSCRGCSKIWRSRFKGRNKAAEPAGRMGLADAGRGLSPQAVGARQCASDDLHRSVERVTNV